ncbi:MAG: heparan-alpha-glucosaminide N-acetyltransferase domain-containing protein [Desulfobacteraceae bacterium]|nr:heparan-alpha-glucosaminide N-acetyltransferase domain-containing protein [Desulfobacteraceae bacterium]
MAKKRLLSVDSLRGFAMVLVLLQHSYLSTNSKLIPFFIDKTIWLITYSAAIAFVSISGAIYSYFLFMAHNWKSIYKHYAKRALFIIIVGHIAIGFTAYYFNTIVLYGGSSGSYSLFRKLLGSFPITDVIGFFMLIAPAFIVRVPPKARAALVVFLLLIPIPIKSLNLSDNHALNILKEVLFGTPTIPEIFWFPLVPWFAIFLCGSFVGEALANVNQNRTHITVLLKRINSTAFLLLACSLGLTLFYKLLKITFNGHVNSNFLLSLYPNQTTTLLPGYLAILVWILAASMKRIDVMGRYDKLQWYLSILGRTSFFTYIVQFAIVESLPALLGINRSLNLVGFGLLFVTGVVITWWVSFIYGRLRGWITGRDYQELSQVAYMETKNRVA